MSVPSRMVVPAAVTLVIAQPVRVPTVTCVAGGGGVRVAGGGGGRGGGGGPVAGGGRHRQPLGPGGGPAAAVEGRAGQGPGLLDAAAVDVGAVGDGGPVGGDAGDRPAGAGPHRHRRVGGGGLGGGAGQRQVGPVVGVHHLGQGGLHRLLRAAGQLPLGLVTGLALEPVAGDRLGRGGGGGPVAGGGRHRQPLGPGGGPAAAVEGRAGQGPGLLDAAAVDVGAVEDGGPVGGDAGDRPAGAGPHRHRRVGGGGLGGGAGQRQVGPVVGVHHLGQGGLHRLLRAAGQLPLGLVTGLALEPVAGDRLGRGGGGGPVAGGGRHRQPLGPGGGPAAAVEGRAGQGPGLLDAAAVDVGAVEDGGPVGGDAGDRPAGAGPHRHR